MQTYITLLFGCKQGSVLAGYKPRWNENGTNQVQVGSSLVTVHYFIQLLGMSDQNFPTRIGNLIIVLSYYLLPDSLQKRYLHPIY